MCTGKVPFKDETIMRTIILIEKGVQEEIPSDRYSKELRDLVNSMLTVKGDLTPNIDEILQLSFLKDKSQRIDAILKTLGKDADYCVQQQLEAEI
jgi:hypothetical protein